MTHPKTITLAHGNGGHLMHELIETLRTRFSNKILNEMADAAGLEMSGRHLSFSTDSFVVRPLFFPGGDIGKLAVCGTVNDVAMKGAKPLYLSLAFIIEEGLAWKIFEKIADSIAKEAKSAGVQIVTGDIKVVETGAADKIFINTAGIGLIANNRKPLGAKARAGDVIIINGPIAEHGLAVLEAREQLGFMSKIKSDCQCVHKQVARAMDASKDISMMRDPTRGGLATALNEMAHASNLGIEVCEKDIPIKKDVRKMCDILGFDPCYMANEGKFICCVAQKDAQKVKKAMGSQARIIGKVTSLHKKQVHLQTLLGTSRILPVLEADQLPRIC